MLKIDSVNLLNSNHSHHIKLSKKQRVCLMNSGFSVALLLRERNMNPRILSKFYEPLICERATFYQI
jgi:hypothetical protein